MKVVERNREVDAIFQASPLPIFALDSDSRVKVWNPAAERIFGWSEEEILGQRLPMFSGDQCLEHAHLSQAVGQGEPQIRIQVRRKQDSAPFAEAVISSAPLFNSEGEPDGMMAIITNLIEKTASAWSFEDSQQRYGLLFQNNPYPAWIYDLKTLSFLAVNEAAINHYGYSEAEFLNLTVKNIYVDSLQKSGLDAVAETDAKLSVWKHQKKDGAIIDVETTSRSFTFEGQPVELVLIHDITEHKQRDETLTSEHELLHVLMDSIPDTIYFKDTASRFIRINEAQAKTLGLEDAEDAIGKSDFDFFTSEHAADAYADEQRLIKTRQPVIGKVEKIRTGTGQFRWVSATKVPMVNKRGLVTGIAGISRDVTLQRQAEEQLRVFTAKLEQSNRELQDFASVASHDLQEPLRKIQAFGDRLRGKCGPALTAEGLDYLDRMQSAAQRMQILINDLLTFSRVATKARPFVPVNLSEIVNGVLSDLEVRIEQKHGRVEVGELPDIDADELQLRQLFQNLIGNALKFHREGESPIVKVNCRLLEDPGLDQSKRSPDDEFCEIRVEDNGIGFEEKYLDRIFDVFQRLHGRGAYEGTGIGLAVCRKIAERHGGDITATSVPGQGSTFIVRLPLKQHQQEVGKDEQTC